MKSKTFIFSFIFCLISILFSIRTVWCQLDYIPDVPDLNQPIDPFWGLLPDNACAPVSAANICIYWDKIMLHSNAIGLNPGIGTDSIPGFIYYFMDTHDLGDTTRANGRIYPMKPGTYTIDIDSGFRDYVRWDTTYLLTTPSPQLTVPTFKKGFDWNIALDKVQAFALHQIEIDAGRPDIVTFQYWNPDSSSVIDIDPVSGDTIRFMTWDVPISVSDPPHPHEEWFFESKDESVGHAVTGVGYYAGYDPDGGGTLPLTDWIICHDNWASSPTHIAIPWQNWVATITADPGFDSTAPIVYCRDDSVFLTAYGDAYIYLFNLVDSTWDNKGIDSLVFSQDYFTCSDIGDTSVIITAYDTDGNTGTCLSNLEIRDTLSPEIYCLDIDLYLDDQGEAEIDRTYIVDMYSDNCATNYFVLSDTLFTRLDVAASPVQVVVQLFDESGNVSHCISEVTVLDTFKVSGIKDNSIHSGDNIWIEPNPFNEFLTIHYSIDKPGEVTVSLLNVEGRSVETIENGFHVPGDYSITWHNKEGLKNGIYFIQLQNNNSTEVVKVICH